VLFTPLLLGFALNGVCLKTGALAALARPVDGGARWRGRRLFGDNKTWRGIVAVALGTGLGFLLLHGRWFGVGVLAGTAAMLAELPNSFCKRQLDIAPGAQAAGRMGALFHVIDQVDVVAGAWLVLWLVVPPTLPLVLASFAFVFVAHQVATVVGYALGLRATWR
jgi:hypothetical protein